MASEAAAGGAEPVPQVVFRPMLLDDIAVAAELEKDAYPYPWTEGIFRDCIRVGYECHVIDLGGRVIGYGILSSGAGEAHILNVCVSRELRCRGFGRRMIEFLLERARETGMREVFLEVRPSNVAAVRLYGNLGFEQIGMRKGYYPAAGGREDAMVFKRSLAG